MGGPQDLVLGHEVLDLVLQVVDMLLRLSELPLVRARMISVALIATIKRPLRVSPVSVRIIIALQ